MRAKQYVVFGAGRFGTSVSMTLAESGYEVMVVDSKEDVIQDIAPFVTYAVSADVTDPDALKELGIRNFDVAIVAIGKDMQASIMLTMLLKEMGINYVVAKASTEIHQRILEKVGADRIILPEYEMGKRLAANLISGNIMDYIELSKDYSIMEIAILPAWSGHTILEIDVRSKYGINIIAIKRDKQIEISPSPVYKLTDGDTLIVVGANKSLQELEAKRDDE